MSNAETEGTPVSVHIHSAAPGVLDGKAPAGTRYRAVYRTVSVTATDNGKELWAASDDREYALVVAVDDPIMLASTRQDAEKGDGYIVGALGAAGSDPLMIKDSGVTWAANYTGTFSGPASNSRICVAAFYRIKS